jgi:GTP-binding protein
VPIPRFAIVGRPNAGKSSLMNMIAGAKVSIVDPTPGVTRDRVSAIVEIDPPLKASRSGRGGRGAREEPKTDEPKAVEFVDTGGFGVYVTEGNRYDEIGNDLAKLTQSIEFQIEQATRNADVVLFCVDAQAGVTPADKEIARLLREGAFRGQRGKKSKAEKSPPAKPPLVRVVATKIDGPKWEAHAAELAALGFGQPLMVSAKNNYMRRELMHSLYDLAPSGAGEAEHAGADLLLAIVGKRNAGKSTLVNTLAGEERVIASEIPGTTRDAVDVRFEMDGKSIVAIDTAGLRRKRSFQNMIDHYAFDRVQRSIDRSDVVLVLLDATERISQVDEHLAQMAVKAYKPVIVVVNKWDLAEGRRDDKGRPATPKRYEEYVRKELGGLWFAPIAFTSGASGRNVRRTIALALEMKDQAGQRVTTGKLNRVVRAILDTRGPSDIRGRFAKVYYVAQTGVEPPTITMVVNHPDMFTSNYLRFLSNRFREELPFKEVPLRIVVRARRQREDDLVSADEAGVGGTIRVSRGRKGVAQRVGGRRVGGKAGALPEPEGDQWLSDEFSEAVDVAPPTESSDKAEDFFDDEEE